MGRMSRVLVLLVGFLTQALAWAADPLVVVLSSERSGPHAQTLDALQPPLLRGPPVAAVNVAYGSEVAEAQALLQRSPKVMVALGATAVRAALQADGKIPLVAALVPRTTLERLVREIPRKNGAPVHALYLDQPFTRQLELIAQVVPQVRRLGVLWGPASVAQRPALQTALATRGWTEAAYVVSDGSQVGEGLRTVLEGSDVFLAVADPVVLNATTVSNVLLGTYRARVGVFAFAPAYTQAGALASVHSTPAQIGAQTAEIVRSILRGSTPPPAQFPTDFQISVNTHVAHSLGLELNEADLTERIKRLERRP